jgi:hypothetical protein
MFQPLSGSNRSEKESIMESLICRTLMLSGLIVGVLLAGGQGGQALVPAILALVGVASAPADCPFPAMAFWPRASLLIA